MACFFISSFHQAADSCVYVRSTVLDFGGSELFLSLIFHLREIALIQVLHRDGGKYNIKLEVSLRGGAGK